MKTVQKSIFTADAVGIINFFGIVFSFIPFKTQLFGWLSGMILALLFVAAIFCFIIKPQHKSLFIAFMVIIGLRIFAIIVGSDPEFR